MRAGINVIAIMDYKPVGLKKDMTGTIEKIFNDDNMFIYWNELERSLYHHKHHRGYIFNPIKAN